MDINKSSGIMTARNEAYSWDEPYIQYIPNKSSQGVYTCKKCTDYDMIGCSMDVMKLLDDDWYWGDHGAIMQH